jgi:hypothetical protein
MRSSVTEKPMVERTNLLKGINAYGRQLTPEEIESNVHRAFVGGMWEEIGRLQFDFLRGQGLKPDH